MDNRLDLPQGKNGTLRRDIFWWTSGELVANFGDFLTEYLMRRALTGKSKIDAAGYRIIGSTLHPELIYQDLMSIGEGQCFLYWGCGARAPQPLGAHLVDRCVFQSVRGPLTRDLLRLSVSTPLGDPGLLMPLILPTATDVRHVDTVGKTIVVPHLLDSRNRADLIASAGCDMCVEPGIQPTPKALELLIKRIVGAKFVLTASLHAAVVAVGYNRPFAYWAGEGSVDVPFKWMDFAASLDIPTIFARDAEEGENLYKLVIRPRIRKPPLKPVLDAAPFAPAPQLEERAVFFDRSNSTSPAWMDLSDDLSHFEVGIPGDVRWNERVPTNFNAVTYRDRR